MAWVNGGFSIWLIALELVLLCWFWQRSLTIKPAVDVRQSAIKVLGVVGLLLFLPGLWLAAPAEIALFMSLDLTLLGEAMTMVWLLSLAHSPIVQFFVRLAPGARRRRGASLERSSA